jgi:hypothetical protein
MFKMRLSLARRHLFSLQHGNTAAHSTLLRGGGIHPGVERAEQEAKHQTPKASRRRRRRKKKYSQVQDGRSPDH